MINTELIKKLREATQAGMMDCKKALEENNNDYEAAVQWLREKGIAKAAKKAGSVATEGVVLISQDKDKAAILELNCQTDFVAKNEQFLELAKIIMAVLLKNNIKTVEECNNFMFPKGQTVSTMCDELSGRIGEKIALRRFEVINKKSEQQFSYYQHSNNRVGSLLLLSNVVNEEIAKNLAMHATAMAPKFLNSTKVDENWLENEKKVLIEQTIAEGKPAAFAEKIVAGRINKLLAENCLLDQPYVKDASITVAKYLKNNNTEAIEYVRYEVGEGIEKKESNFADEVAQQMSVE